MVTKSFEDEIREILTNLPSESSCIDYKVIPYKPEKYSDLIKDIISMLNSEDGYTFEKYIIIGVNNDHKKIGLVTPMQDDSELQSIVDKIRPRPEVQTGTLSFNGLEFGYIKVNGSNDERVYEVDSTYPQSTHLVHEGQAFIRRCSSTSIMKQQERRRIENTIREDTRYSKSNYDPNDTFAPPTTYNSTLSPHAIAFLLGSWNENYPSDIQLIEALSKENYLKWIPIIQNSLTNEDFNLSFLNGVWELKDRIELVPKICSSVFNSHMDVLEKFCIDVLSEIDPKFHVPFEHRILSFAEESSLLHSENLRSSLSETLAILSFTKDQFKNCTFDRIIQSINKIVSNTLKNKDWMVWESIGWNLKYLAQASPNEFFKAIEGEIRNSENQIKRLFEEKDGIISQQSCGNGLINALQTLAWSKKYFAQSCNILAQLELLIPDQNRNLSLTLLPWNAQTEVSSEIRVGVIKSILKENREKSWNFLKLLLPNQVTTAMSIEKPHFLAGNFSVASINVDDYWTESGQYLDIALEIASGKSNLMLSIIEIMDDVLPGMRDKILLMFLENSEIITNEIDRYRIWDRFLSLINKHRKFIDADWAFSKEQLHQIGVVADRLQPKSEILRISRLFKNEQYDLLNDRNDYFEAEKNLQELKIDTIKHFYEMFGMEGIFSLVDVSDKPELVGISLSKAIGNHEIEVVAFEMFFKVNKPLQFAKGYLYQQFLDKGYSWIKEIDSNNWEIQKKAEFLTLLTFSKETWDFVDKWLGDNAYRYWTSVSINRVEVEDTSYAISWFIRVNRNDEALQLIANDIIENKYFDEDTVFSILEMKRSTPIKENSLTSFYIAKVINRMQSKCSDLDRLALIEWNYSEILNDEVVPKTLYFKIANQPDFYMQLLGYVYKRENIVSDEDSEKSEDPIKEILFSHSWNVLFHWNSVPGTDENGIFSEELFTIWVNIVKETSQNTGLYKVAMTTLGNVSFYSRIDTDGFFINHAVAKMLNLEESEFQRQGYRIQAVNSRGVHWVDSTGVEDEKLAMTWDEKAYQAEIHGYIRFAKILKDIAEIIRNEKERNVWESSSSV